jgi:hypothetical protein
MKGYIKAEKVTNSNQAQSGVPVATQTETTQLTESQNNDNNDNNNNNVEVDNNDNENNAKPIQQGENVKIQVVAPQTINIRKETSTDSDIVAKLYWYGRLRNG